MSIYMQYYCTCTVVLVQRESFSLCCAAEWPSDVQRGAHRSSGRAHRSDRRLLAAGARARGALECALRSLRTPHRRRRDKRPGGTRAARAPAALPQDSLGIVWSIHRRLAVLMSNDSSFARLSLYYNSHIYILYILYLNMLCAEDHRAR